MHRIKKDALFVIDGSYLLYRSFYGIKPLYTSTGIPTNATYGFIRAIKKIIDQYAPQQLIVAWDSKGPVHRHTTYPAYKATRQKPPNELFIQKEYIIKVLDSIKLCQISEPGFEADDLIADLTEHYANHQVVLVCPDKDVYQLLNDHVIIIDPFKNRIIDEALFTAEHGFGPKKVAFYYALLGDSSDNIPGVVGVGEKTAQELVTTNDSLDDLYKHLDRVKKPRIRTLLEEQEINARLSLSLFTLTPKKIDMHAIDPIVNLEHWHNAYPLFRELEFFSLLPSKSAPKAPEQETQGSIFAPAPTQGQPQAADWICTTITTTEQLKTLIATLHKHKHFALDTETTGTDALACDLVGMSFAYNQTEAFYVPVAHTSGTQIQRDEALALLKPLLESTDSKIVMHHAKYDQLVLAAHGIAMPPVTFDTILAANLLKKEWQKIGLKDLAAYYLHEEMQTFKEVAKGYKTFAQVPIEQGAAYAAHDAHATFMLEKLFKQQLADEKKLEHIFYTVEMPFAYVLTKIERQGILLDTKKLAVVGAKVTHELDALEEKINTVVQASTGTSVHGINLRSPQQLATLLFDTLGLPCSKKSAKGGRTTDQEVLQELSTQHPLPSLIIRHRELEKLKNTYIDPLPTLINKRTGKLHTSYSQTQVATGRLSSNNPNLQNIPTGEGFGIQIRDAFIADPETIFLSADYSQVELRIMAHLSGDKALCEAFASGADIHTHTASLLFQVAPEDVTHEQRQLGKRINFSIMYGITPFGLAKDLKISSKLAKQYITQYLDQYSGVASWMEKTIALAVQEGYVETWMGRRRYIPELKERNKMLFEAGKRIAINTPVQGTQAEIMKCAMMAVDHKITQTGINAPIVLQIHDEIVLQVPTKSLADIEKIVIHELEHIVDWQVKLTVSTRTGLTWGEVTK